MPSHLSKPKHPHHVLALSIVAVVLAMVMSIGSVSSGEEVVITAAAEETVLSADEEIPFLAAPTTTTTVPPTTTTTAAPTTTTTAPPAPPDPAPAPVPVAAVERPVGECSGWLDLIAAHFPAEQVGTACRVMACESGGNPTAENRSSSASGLFQFLSGTWTSTTGLAPPASAYAPAIQVEAAATLWRSSGWGPWSCF